ncbi:MbtH family NRPS accessory protein [Amycolatopsis sp. NPDC051045]|uniref:MbtH family protein n=1 Tax=Amycolatopsis sp. NPDC051045 TaxID=3156922 RepID=UPI0034469DDC
MDHVVVIDPEGRYSLLPETVAVPPGWRPAGFTGTRQDCLDLIDRQWTDIRPAGVRPEPRPDRR